MIKVQCDEILKLSERLGYINHAVSHQGRRYATPAYLIIDSHLLTHTALGTTCWVISYSSGDRGSTRFFAPTLHLHKAEVFSIRSIFSTESRNLGSKFLKGSGWNFIRIHIRYTHSTAFSFSNILGICPFRSITQIRVYLRNHSLWIMLRTCL